MRKSLAALGLAALALAIPTAALAGNGHGNGPRGDSIDVGRDVKVKEPRRKDLPASIPAPSVAAKAAAAAEESPPVGTVKIWPLINFNTGQLNIANFTLRAVGDKIEIWVANNLNYPTAGDCRNDGVRNVITDAQTTYLRGQFDENMYPKMTEEFSSPPSRDGTDAELEDIAPALFPEGYFKGPGDKIVTLIANFQDENYLDINFPSYVAGYHSSDINAFVNRNVMSIDSYDWAHRTGPNPPNEPSTVLCQNRPAQPFKYEGVFAHEYQHLLEFWASPGEATWVNEGLADYAITVTGYGFPARTIEETAWDSHIQTFLGWRLLQTPANQIPQPLGGPENSLTIWDDQGGLETLADYGAAWTFMELLHSRYGDAFMTDFHNEDANGLEGLQAVLDKYLTGKTTRELIHEWSAMVALDRSIDDGAKLRGAQGGDLPGRRAPRGDLLGEPAGVLDARRTPERLRLRAAPGRGGQSARGHGHPLDRVRRPRGPYRAADGMAVGRRGRVTRSWPPAQLRTSTARSSARSRFRRRATAHSSSTRATTSRRAGTSASCRCPRTVACAGRASATPTRRTSTTAVRSARSSPSCRASTASRTGGRRRSTSPPTPARPSCCGSG